MVPGSIEISSGRGILAHTHGGWVRRTAELSAVEPLLIDVLDEGKQEGPTLRRTTAGTGNGTLKSGTLSLTGWVCRTVSFATLVRSSVSSSLLYSMSTLKSASGSVSVCRSKRKLRGSINDAAGGQLNFKTFSGDVRLLK